MAFGVAVVLAVWTVAGFAVAGFSRSAPAAEAAPDTRGPALVQDLASPTPYHPPTATAIPAPTTTAGVPAAVTGPRSSTLAGGHAAVTSPAAVAPPVVTAPRAVPAPTAGAAPAIVPTSAPATPTPGPSARPRTPPSSSAPSASTAPDSDSDSASPPAALVAPVLDGNAQSAAQRYGWGAASRIDTFDDPAVAGWGRYNGPGHAGNGTRSAGAVTAQGGVLTLSGDANGTTGGMAWGAGQQYGRWEVRMRAPVGDSSYHALALLWPDAENWPIGGEVDFAEISDAARQKVDGFLHYGASNSQASASTAVDAAQWHNWAVEWTPGGITYFVDGVPWFQVTDPAKLPPGPMHLCLQLDWFPDGGAITPTQMQVDDVAYYPLNGSGTSPAIVPGAGATVPPVAEQPGAGSSPTTTGGVPTTTVTPPPAATTAPPASATTPPVTTTTPPVHTTTPPVPPSPTPSTTTPPATTPPATTPPATTRPVTTTLPTTPPAPPTTEAAPVTTTAPPPTTTTPPPTSDAPPLPTSSSPSPT